MLSGVKFIPRDQLQMDLEKKKRHEDSVSRHGNELARKELGLGWMYPERASVQTSDTPEEPGVVEEQKLHPRELNPYYKDGGCGLPEDEVQTKVPGDELLSSSNAGDRKRMYESLSDGRSVNDGKRDYLEDASVRRPVMRVPKVDDSWFGKKRKGETAQVISAANDGSFLRQHASDHNNEDDDISCSSGAGEPSEERAVSKQELSVNQLTAKATKLRMKGMKAEAEKLWEEIEIIKRKDSELNFGDMNLVDKIVQNKQYGEADDEYVFEIGPIQRRRKKKVAVPDENKNYYGIASRILTQKERCQFCFENPTRPKHLVVAMGSFTYLALPQQKPVVQGHCYILPMQHEAATRNIEDNVWEEIRNFKKCLIMMFAKQGKDVVFLETVMGIAKQRRHCLVECIPLPRDIAKQAPAYFKNAIDEAEDEWSQHNAKKLIDTSEKGLRGSIPEDFPYFHVEFGLDKGFVHVIDDESQFKSNMGINVIRCMLKLPEEDMYRRHQENDFDFESQKQAVQLFDKEWKPFDWTQCSSDRTL